MYIQEVPVLIEGNNVVVPVRTDDASAEEVSLNLMLARATQLEHECKFVDTEECLREAAHYAEWTFGANSRLRALALFKLSAFYNRQEKYVSAREFYGQFLWILNHRQFTSSN